MRSEAYVTEVVLVRRTFNKAVGVHGLFAAKIQPGLGRSLDRASTIFRPAILTDLKEKHIDCRDAIVKGNG